MRESSMGEQLRPKKKETERISLEKVQKLAKITGMSFKKMKEILEDGGSLLYDSPEGNPDWEKDEKDWEEGRRTIELFRNGKGEQPTKEGGKVTKVSRAQIKLGKDAISGE